MINLKTKIYRLLRWSERYTKTDMVYLAKGGFWLTLGQAVSSLSSFVLAIAFANLLPKETYGTYKYVLSLVGILSIPTLAGMNTAVTRAVARGYEGTPLPALKTKIKWGTLGSLSSLALALYYYLHHNTTLSFSFLIAAIFIPFLEAFSLYGAFLQGKKMFDVFSRYFASIKIGAVTALILTLLITQNLFFILLIYFLSWTTLRFFFFRKSIQKFKNNKESDTETISYGKKLTLINIIGTIANQIDKILVFHFLGATELAIYTFAIIPPEQIKAVLKNVGTLALPKFSEKSMTEIKKRFFKKIFVFSLSIIAIIILYIILAPFVYKFFFSQYLNSIFYSQIFSLSLIAIPLLIILSIFKAQKKVKKLYWFNFPTSSFQIIISFLGVYFYGLIGIIIGRIIARFFNLALSFYLLKK